MPVEPLDRESEPYSRYGNISADGIQRLLGAPNLNALQILIRETVQNSWDAGKDLPGRIGYLIRFRELNQSEHKALRNIVFDDLPNYSENPERPIGETLRRKKLRVIEICDFGTTGLAGPTHPDAVPIGDESPDFVDFLRNIGSPRDTVFGGGTYGYGKSCLYAISQCQTIVVDSATTEAGAYTRRFMACRIASRYDITDDGPEKGRYTGRHWWGRKSDDDHLEPVSGDEAVSLSKALGMCPRGPENLGTSIMIIAPNLDTDDLQEAALNAIRILLWYCWPKVVESEEGQPAPMSFSVEANGQNIPVPHPSTCPPLNLFANSLQNVRGKTEDCIEIRSNRPDKRLGHLHISRDLKKDRLPHFSSDNDLYPDFSSHVALMRPAELVVRYLTGDKLPSENVEWGGVFVCSEEAEVEQAFAAAEPPAHDDWDPRSLQGKSKTYVRGALNRIKKNIAEVTGTLPTNPDDDSERSSLGLVADSLGLLLGNNEGQRLGNNDQGPAKKKSRKKVARVSLSKPVFTGHEIIDEQCFALFEITASSTEPVLVIVEGAAKIAKDGGGADSVDPRGNSAHVSTWRSKSGIEQAGSSIDLCLDGEERLTATVSIPEGKAISFNANFEEVV